MPTSLTMTSLPRSRLPMPKAADREDHDKSRDRDPGPLTPVQPPQDQVVHGARRARCSRTAATNSPPIGGSARLGRWDTAETMLSRRPASMPPGGSRRQQATPERVSQVSPAAIQSAVGSKPMRVDAPLPILRSAAMTRSPDVARTRPAPASPAYAVSVAAPPAPRRGRPQDRAGHVQDAGRSVGQQVVREAGEAVRTGGPADDHQTPSAGDPACAWRRAAPC